MEITNKHLINCDAKPSSNPEQVYSWINHKKQGLIEWNKESVSLFPFIEKLNSEMSRGGTRNLQLQKELQDKVLPNVNMRDYLFDHPELIPEKWKQGDIEIYFLGTQYYIPRYRGPKYPAATFIPGLRWGTELGRGPDKRWCKCSWGLTGSENKRFFAVVLEENERA